MGELNINEVKFIRNIVKESKRTAKMESCPICGKIQTSFCNSHSIPQFVLQNIACNGMLLQLYTFSSNIWMPVSELRVEKGVSRIRERSNLFVETVTVNIFRIMKMQFVFQKDLQIK